MYESELAKITIDTIDMLTVIFQNNKISFEEYENNLAVKLHFLEVYLKNINDKNEKERIKNFIQKTMKISKASDPTGF